MDLSTCLEAAGADVGASGAAPPAGVRRRLTGGVVRLPHGSRAFTHVRNALVMRDDIQGRITALAWDTPTRKARVTVEDAQQQATLIAIRAIDRWMNNEALQERFPLRQHVFTMTRYRLKDWRRRESLWLQKVDPVKYRGRHHLRGVPGWTPVDEVYLLLEGNEDALARVNRDELREQLEGVLTGVEWACLEATVIDELPHEEAAKMIGVTRRAVKAGWARAKRKVRAWANSRNSENRGVRFSPLNTYLLCPPRDQIRA